MHSIADIVLRPTGHENSRTGAQWKALNDGYAVHSNGKISFSIPKRDHQRVYTEFFFATKAQNLCAFYEKIGAEFGKNGGVASRGTVSKCVKAIAKAQKKLARLQNECS